MRRPPRGGPDPGPRRARRPCLRRAPVRELRVDRARDRDGCALGRAVGRHLGNRRALGSRRGPLRRGAADRRGGRPGDAAAPPLASRRPPLAPRVGWDGRRPGPRRAGVTGPAAREVLAGREPPGGAASRPGFAHASEAEFARILDFYQVEWRYEPHAFPIQWSLDGAVLESFAPDFYLPELDLYVEMTTLRQKLVRKKNRKLRRLRELYPDVRIKLFYARDFRALMLKYGRVALADALSGSEGQFTPANPGPAAE